MADFANRIRAFVHARIGKARHPGTTPGRSATGRVHKAQGPRWAANSSDDLTIAPDVRAKQSVRPGPVRRRSAGGTRVTSLYVWGALALVATVVAISGAVVHLRKAALTAEELSRPLAADPLAPLSEPTRVELLDPAPELGAELKRVFLGKPDDLCAELGALGLENRGWRRAPFRATRWQCASDLVPLTTPSVDFGGTTLFFLLRGPSADKVDYLRLKLVVEDPRQKALGLDAVWLVIDALARRYGWTVPENFRAAVDGFAKLETLHHGVQLSVAPEDPALTGDPLASGRLNIIMNFGEPDLIRPADRFRKAPPLESGWTRDGAGAHTGKDR